MNLNNFINFIENEVLTIENVLFLEQNIKEIKEEIGTDEIYLFQDGENYISLYEPSLIDTINNVSETNYKLIKTL